ncbi:MAG: hypothetical protein RBS80_10525 [Thermoguttaceae bacterium]|jgi:Tfp pilus assembly PilM family ATPase|nr:hypothetical protein [Thermoguttaceae bacterium]
MPRQIAIELSRSEARVLLVRTAGAEVTVEQAFCVPAELDDDANRAEALEKAVVAALAERGISRLPAVGVVGRADVELRLLHLPPAPDDELPDLVRFQADQEFPNLEADAALDFLPLDGGGDQPRRVLAAALKPDLAERFRRICGAAKLSLGRLVLHPAAAAALAVRRSAELASGWCLLIDVLDGQAELTAILRGGAAFSRQVFLPDGLPAGDEAAEALSIEVRRTRAAAANQEAAPMPEPAVLFGHGAEWSALAQRLAGQLGVGVELVDPFAGARGREAADDLAPGVRARFAGLMGALEDEAGERAPALDFLHPRKRPQPPSRRRAYVLGGLAAAAVVLTLLTANWIQSNRLRASIRDLQQESRSLDRQVAEADKMIGHADEIGKWVEGEVVWLDELRWLSENFTPAQDAMLTKLVAAAAAGRTEIRLDGLARSVDAASQLDRKLQDETHRLLGQTKSEDRSDSQYRIQFRSTVQIERPQ